MKTSTEASVRAASSAWGDARPMNVVDCAAMLWAERALVLGLGAVICTLGLVAALMAPKAYTAHTELIVRTGEEYVYEPNTGGAGATPDMQAVMNAEMRLIGSVVRAAIAEVGLATLYPDIAAAPGSEARKIAAAEGAFARHLTIETSPQTPAIGLSFEHRNPEIAAQALNALVERYLVHRRTVLVGGGYDALFEETPELSAPATQASTALAAFLTEHQIGDFESERAALAARADNIETQLLDAQARRREAEARADALRARQLLGRAADNITPVARAAVPTQGKSLRWPIMIVTLLIAAVVAVGAGLSRALMRRSFPTPSSAARALEARVLAVLPRAAKATPPKSAKAPRPPKKGKPELVLVEGGA